MSDTATAVKTYKLDDYQSPEYSTWCPGCGDFPILKCLKESLMAQEIGPHQVMIVSGIGCGSKLPYYIRANVYNALHGRSLPIAQAIKLANHALKVIAVTGDGDGLGIGGNHFLHAMRRNPDITHIIENNQIYALTKGQASPTSDKGFITSTSPEGSIEQAINPIVLGIACGATFIARSSSGDPKHLTEIITRAMHDHCDVLEIPVRIVETRESDRRLLNRVPQALKEILSMFLRLRREHTTQRTPL